VLGRVVPLEPLSQPACLRGGKGFLARLIQRIAEIQKRQLYKALNTHIDPVSRPLHLPDRREFRFVYTLWSPKPAAVRLCLR
jgi:hypothetical protein